MSCITYQEHSSQGPRLGFLLLLRIPGRVPVSQGMLSDTALAAVDITNPTNEHIQVQVSGGYDQASCKNTLEHSVRRPIGRREKLVCSPRHDRCHQSLKLPSPHRQVRDPSHPQSLHFGGSSKWAEGEMTWSKKRDDELEIFSIP